MEGFNENDTIPSFNSSELIEEVDDDDIEEDEDDVEDDDIEEGEDDVEDEEIGEDDDNSENEDDNNSSVDSYEAKYRTTKRLKTMTAADSSFKMKVMKVLKQSWKVAGDFAVSGKLNHTPLVAISLKNRTGGADECIKFPLEESDVNEIIDLFEPSPYGKGAETIVDTAVRSSFQLNPDGFEILNSDWDKFIRTDLVSRVKQELSLECSIVPQLHKLLLYTSGSFFKSHRDSEKEANMFGTLVVQLPSKFKGGQLVVHHDGKTKLFDFSSNGATNNAFSSFFSAFYCDCEHEILPVTEGYRLCLVYNLITTDTEIPLAPQNHALETELVTLLQNWEDSRKLVFALTHKYSEENLSFTNLKTTDRIVANILKRVSSACALNIYLGLLEKDCSGNGDEYGNYNCRGCASDFDGDYDEVSYTLKALIADVKNEKLEFSNLNVDFTKEVIPIDCFNFKKPYEQDCEHTGNEGVHISKSYRCAAITFWPQKFTFQVLKTSNAPQSLTDNFFLKEAEKYFEDDCSAEIKDKILTWAKFTATQRPYGSPGENIIAIVNTIVKFNDVELIQKLIHHGLVSAPKTFSLIIKEFDKYGWEQFATATVEMFKQTSQKFAIENLILLFGNGNLNQEKQKVFTDLLQVIFNKRDIPCSYYYSSDDKMKHLKEDKDSLEPLMNAVLQFNDLQLMQKFVNCILPLHSETLSLLATICEKYGWEPFATAIADKFKNLSKKDEVIYLTWLIQNGILNDDKKTLCLSLFKVMMEKTEELKTYSFYHRMDPPAQIDKHRKDERELLEPLLNAAITFNDVELLKNLFERIVPLHSETIPVLISLSKICGWNAFAREIGSKFEKLSQVDAIDMLSLLIQNGNLKEEKILCFNLFQMILNKNHLQPSNHFGPTTPEEKSKYLKEKQDILHSICRVAENIKFSLMAFAKNQSFKVFVPVLLRLVQQTTKRLSPFWATIALHFIAEMGKESIKQIEISWRREINSLIVCCNDCVSLNFFLGSNKQHDSFKIGEKRRKHLQQRIDFMETVSHRTEIGGRGQVGVLVVTKTEMSGAEAIQDRNLSKSLLEKLRSVMPYH